LNPEQKLVVIRLVRHDALHDVGISEMSMENWLTLVNEISTLARVVISTGISGFSNQGGWVRLGAFDDLARAILLLSCNASAYITGSEITVDGGHSMKPLV
jgi:NAD(P)-dependent dehydrogenase (short-subunit alcohol dehydrogenase family)